MSTPRRGRPSAPDRAPAAQRGCRGIAAASGQAGRRQAGAAPASDAAAGLGRGLAPGRRDRRRRLGVAASRCRSHRESHSPSRGSSSRVGRARRPHDAVPHGRRAGARRARLHRLFPATATAGTSSSTARRPATWWPWMHAEIRDAAAGIDELTRSSPPRGRLRIPCSRVPARGRRFYLVQDFEPAFHPAGSTAMMAESTYRFGFHGVTAGRWLAERLRADYGMRADHFDFGRDLDYSLDARRVPRRRGPGSACTAAPETPRRAFELAVLTLELLRASLTLKSRFTSSGARCRPAVRRDGHGLLRPDGLNALYNRCVAGLVLSATNVSLVPHEMLAAGCIPVVNDAEHNRIVLDNEHVAYAPGTPFELARRSPGSSSARSAIRAAARRPLRRARGPVVGRCWCDRRADRPRGRHAAHPRSPSCCALRGSRGGPSVSVVVPCYRYGHYLPASASRASSTRRASTSGC